MKKTMNKKQLYEMIEQELMTMKPAMKKPDHEAAMARGEIRDMIKNGIKLYNLIDKEDELPGWVSAYITLASDYIHSVTEHMTEEKAGDDEETINNPEEFIK